MEFRSLFGQQPGVCERDYPKLDMGRHSSAKLRHQLDGPMETSQRAVDCRICLDPVPTRQLAAGLPTHCSELALAKHREASSAKLAGFFVDCSVQNLGHNMCACPSFRFVARKSLWHLSPVKQPLCATSWTSQVL